MALGLVGATAAQAALTLTIGNSTASPGGNAQFDVTIAGLAADGPAGSIEFNILFNADVFDVTGTSCTIGSNVAAKVTPASNVTGTGVLYLASVVKSADDPLTGAQDGTLWACNFGVKANAPEGPQDLQANDIYVTDPLGLTQIATNGVNGVVTIQVAPADTATPDGDQHAAGADAHLHEDGEGDEHAEAHQYSVRG